MSDRPKVATTIRLDADVLATCKASGKGWQTRISQMLRDYVKTQIKMADEIREMLEKRIDRWTFFVRC